MQNLVDHKSVSVGAFSRMIACEIPGTCPHCHMSMTPSVVFTGAIVTRKTSFPMLYRCTSPDCREYFAVKMNSNAVWSEKDQLVSISEAYIQPYKYSPKPIYDMPDNLDEISESFREIYSQSQLAEGYGLLQITGVGYRKSIEFLIKDYLKHLNITTNGGKDIGKISLSSAINLIPDTDIKTLALASTWLGNDETHYTRVFDDYDLEDMKGFIKALGQRVSSVVHIKAASELIASRSSSSPTS